MSGSHFIIVADEGTRPNQRDAWKAHCTCGWQSALDTEDAASLAANAHAQEFSADIASVAVPRSLLARVLRAGRDGYGHAGAKDCDGCLALAELESVLIDTGET